MANLLKFTQVICDAGDKRIINSNEIIAEKIKKYMEEQQEGDGNYADEFSELLDSEKVGRLLEDKDSALGDAGAAAASAAEAEEIIEQARREAEGIIEQARMEAEAYKRETFDKAQKEGYNTGYAKGTEEAERLKQDIIAEKQRLEQDYQNELEKMEPVLVDTLIEVFESVFQIQFAEKKDFVMHLLQGTLNKIEGSKDYLIRVSKEDFPVLTEKKADIQFQLPHNSAFEVVEDLTLEKNQCLIETDGGVFDCSLDTQMDSLIRDLRTLAGL